MEPESSHLCPECGKPLPAASPHRLCPACLMGQALASRTLVDGDDAGAVPPPLSPEEIAEKFPQFEITECLGRGGMGSVYKARQKSLNRWVAIKILAPEREGRERFAERFAREAQTLARLSHPHIVTIHDFGQTDGLFYLVMEYVDGVNLRELLRDGKIEPAQALTIVPPICDALQYAHDKGVVHRDIKPENLLLDRDGRVKIADFGIASLIGAENESAGTPAYMAPEQNDARREVDHRADIYALGVVLYEMLTGERPGKEVIAPSHKVQIDVRLDEIVLRALEKKPEMRFQEASLFKTEVEAIAETDPMHKAQAPAASRFSGETISQPRITKLALVLFIASLAGPMLMDLVPETFVMIAGAGLALLATLLGLKSWRSRLGKFTTMAAGTWLVVWLVYAIGFCSPWGSLHQYTDQSLLPRLQIPKNYGGLLVVAHPLAAYPELPIRGDKQILRFPENGVLLTSSPLRFGLSATRFLETYDPETEQIWGGSEMSCHFEDYGFGTTEDGTKFEFRVFVVGDEGYWQHRKEPLDSAALKEEARQHVFKHLKAPLRNQAATDNGTTQTPASTATKAEERYSLKVQFGDRPDDPALTTDVQLGVAFSQMKSMDQRVVSIDGRIDPPTGGIYRGELHYLDVSKNLSVQKGSFELALEPGVPSRFWMVSGIARSYVVTLTRKQPDDGTIAPSETQADTSPVVPLIHLKESSLVEALGFLRTKWSMNYTFDRTVTEEWKNAPVLTARWENLTARQIMTELLDLRGLELTEDPQTGVARILPKTNAEANTHRWAPYGQGRPDRSPVVPIIDLKESSLVEALDFLQTKWPLNDAFDPMVTEELKHAPVLTGRWEKLTALQAMTELLDLRGLQLVENSRTGVARIIAKARVSPAPAFPEASQSWDPWAESIKNGDMRRLNGDLAAALEHYQTSLAAAEKTKQDWLRNRRLADSHLKIGDILSARGDFPRALDHYRSSVAAREEQAKKSPQDADVQKQLVWTWVKLGDVQKAQGDLKGAQTSYRGGKEGEARYRQGFEALPINDKPNEPFKPEELTRLAANPKSPRDVSRLMLLINLAGAEKDASFRFLLSKPELRKNAGIEMALLGYDYSVNGNKEALESLLAKLAQQEVGSDSGVVGTLSFIDEWDRSIKAVNAHFTVSDGAGGIVQGLFWLSRAYLFPRRMLEFKGEAGEGAPLKTSASTPQSEPVVLSIEDDGTVFISGERCPEEKLQERLTALGANNPGTPVTLRASKLVPYSRVVAILDICQRAKLQNISFMTH
jgi:tetratricopeptide (TPR) repeat protein/predicted Ser/Thr protein kinase